MTVSDLINELMKIPNQTAEVWIEGNYMRIGMLHIAIGKSTDHLNEE